MSANEATQRPPTAAWPMYRAVVGVGILCGVLIVTVYEATKPVIARNQAEALNAALFRLLPAAESSRTYAWNEDDGFEPLEADRTAREVVYAGYDGANHLVGLAAVGEGLGYQDTVRLLWGYSFSDQTIVGIEVLESRETPGLGDRIATDPAFQKNFEALDVSLDAEQSSLAHPIEAVKSGEKVAAWQVDGITGATISSVAVARILDDSASFWLPHIRRRLADFEEAP